MQVEETKNFGLSWVKLFSVNDSTLTFDIDDLEDTNHIYRRSTHWPKIMNAMKWYIKAGGVFDGSF